MANLKKTMFREYDLRGLVNTEELNPSSVAIIAKAYGTMLRQHGITTCVVGHDLRKGSKEFAEVALKSLTSSGVNAIFIGQVLTPMMYSAQYHYQTKGGMMITASHNPNGWLGFKLALGYSYTFGPAEMKELYNLTVSEDFASGAGSITRADYLPVYTKDVVSRVSLARPMKVVVNAGNGTAGPIAPQILRAAGCEVVEFLCEPDLDFKRYFPNPSLEIMMQDTGEATLQAHADLGIAIDGDGDRLGVTDEKGRLIWPDRYLILLSRAVLKKTPAAPIIFDIKSSRALGEEISKAGGKPVLWKTGHSYIKEKLHQLDAPLAGEMSGHIFFGKPDYYGFDDSIFTALKMLELLSNDARTFSEMVDELPNYVSTPTLQAACKDEVKYDIVAELVRSFQADGYQVVTFEDLKLGGRIEFDYGWGLVRASSNLPALVLRFEAKTAAQLAQIEAMMRERLKKYAEVSEEWENG